METVAASQDQSPLPGSKNDLQAETPDNKAEQARLQILWDTTIKNSASFVRYDAVNALLVSWNETCDDLKTKQEVLPKSYLITLCEPQKAKH